MKKIRVWDYEKKEFYIEENLERLYMAIKAIGDIVINKGEVYIAESRNQELSELLAVKSVAGTKKGNDSYEILFRERIINKFYNLLNPKSIAEVKVYSIDKDKIKEYMMYDEEKSS